MFMVKKTIHITKAEFVERVKKVVSDKKLIHQKIREGKFSELKSDIKFAHPLSDHNNR